MSLRMILNSESSEGSCNCVMEDLLDVRLIRALQKPPDHRSCQDLELILNFLRKLDFFSGLGDNELRHLCYRVRYEAHQANDILYCRDEIATCWYVLLSGSVFIDGSMFLPGSSFGERSHCGGRRCKECLILEDSAMMAVDFPDQPVVYGRPLDWRPFDQNELLWGAGAAHMGSSASPPVSSVSSPHSHYSDGNPHTYVQHPSHYHIPYYDLVRGSMSRGSVGSSIRDGSDTSSACSTSDIAHEVDLTGLIESVVDFEDDLVESFESLSMRDAVWESLGKDPKDRTEKDIKVLLEFTERLGPFAGFSPAVRKEMCKVMVFISVEKAGTVLMNDGEQLDSWTVIINGEVEIIHPDGTIHELHVGDSFGITPTMEKLYHKGTMRSKVNNCQFVCIRQCDYYMILHMKEENTQRIEENGILVLVTEQTMIEGIPRKVNRVVKGTPEKLLSLLVQVEGVEDPTYIQDFLLTHRTFISSPLVVANKLLEWFKDPQLWFSAARVVNLWADSYYNDFASEDKMMDVLEVFLLELGAKNINDQLTVLDVTFGTKQQKRVINLTTDKKLQFNIVGDKEKGIFISNVEKGSKAEKNGLKRGDQILEVNRQSFEKIDMETAQKLLMSSSYLSISVKRNLLAYASLHRPKSSYDSKHLDMYNGKGSNLGDIVFESTKSMVSSKCLQEGHSKKDGMGKSIASRMKGYFNPKLKPTNVDSQVNSDDSVSSQSSSGGQLFENRSNPDIPAAMQKDDPDYVLKVYNAIDQSFKYLKVYKETVAQQVVMLSLPVFNISEASQNFALYEVKVSKEGTVMQKRLRDNDCHLAESIGLGARYYLKRTDGSQIVVPEKDIKELIHETKVHFKHLDPAMLAFQLTLEDFAIFSQIEPTEYIDHLFKLESKYGTPALSKFEELTNKELYWVVHEVCCERNLTKRSKVIKKFIKIAKYCKDLCNFNSMFAIISGLDNASVKRLKQSWDKVPHHDRKLFNDLAEYMNPSCNMSKYRNLVRNEANQSPMIPFFPIVIKDLTFIEYGNKNEVDGLVNFEKLRMISQSIRELRNMCSSPYNPIRMLEQLGRPMSNAIASMNHGITGGYSSATVKRRTKPVIQTEKKMYEEAQMIRKVKTYLSQLECVTDEDELHKMSCLCEMSPSNQPAPHQSTISFGSSSSGQRSPTYFNEGTSSAPSSNPVRKRHHSPTPSVASSNSSTSTSHTSDGKKTQARFGAASPTSARKMMSLAEDKTKPYNGPRPPTSVVANPHPTVSPSRSPGTLPRSSHPQPLYLGSVSSTRRGNHERSHSDTPATPVDLSAESSSVTSLSSMKKTVSSAGSSTSDINGSHYEELSSQNLLSFIPSSPTHVRRHTHQPVESHSHLKNLLHVVKVLPPVPTERSCNRRNPRGSAHPPDYTSTQMRMHINRTKSHEGNHYHLHDDEEDGGQVSAV